MLIRLDVDAFGGVGTVAGVPLRELEDASPETDVELAGFNGATGIIENSDSVQLERSLKVS